MADIKIIEKDKTDTIIRVEFESAPITSEIQIYACANPFCFCKTMYLNFYDTKLEIDNLLFKVILNYETWQIESTEVHNHDMDYTEIIAEFMKSTDDRFIKYIRSQEKPKVKTEHQLRNDIDPSLIRGNGMVYYREIYRIAPYEELVFEYKDKQYLAMDCYCSNPTCNCMDVVLVFFMVENNIAKREAFLTYRVSFKTGRKKIEEMDSSISTHLANELYSKLLSYVCSNGTDFFKNRYMKIKEWGSSRNEFRKITTVVSPKQKPGRNDLCPCGSGKKYKKCCGSNYKVI